MLFAVILLKTSFESTELFINSFNHEDNHSPRQKHFPEGKNYGPLHTTWEQILKCFCWNCYYFLPINYNWVWWSLVFVSTWLLLTAPTSKRKTKGSTLVFNTMLQTFNTTNRKIPEQYQSFKHFISFYI